MTRKKEPEDRVASIAPFGLRMNTDLRDRIADAARASGRSMNSEIVLRLQHSFDSRMTPPSDDDPEAVAALESALRAFRVLAKHPKVAERLHREFLFDEDADKHGV